MTVATLLERFPEFTDVNEVLVSAKLAEAGRRVSASVTGDLYQDLVAYLAAHLIATSPQGQQARLASEAGSSTYWVVYQGLSRIVPTPTMYV